MNPLLANIYGTFGGPDLEKVAAEGGDIESMPNNLVELADLIAMSAIDENAPIEKTASVSVDIHADLVQIDQAGRMMAQAEFSQMEKQAAEGDPSALQEFFADLEVDAEQEQRQQLRNAVAAELAARGLR